tara:strand:+ start:658 stop:1335 length:678 start_codon:yes stop_codon:yes gene_type:complete
MNFFKKKILVKYFSPLVKEDAKNMVRSIPYNYPNYFATIPKTRFEPTLKKFLPFLNTIKTCPGFINLYKRSLLVTSPFDIYVELNDKEIVLQKIGKLNWQTVKVHSNEQLLNYVNTKDYKFILKIELPFILKSDVSLLLSDSSYHFNNLNVFSGIISKNYDSTISFFIPIKKETNTIYIKKEDPLFLITPLCENKIDLKFKKTAEEINQSLTFSELKKFILDKVT